MGGWGNVESFSDYTVLYDKNDCRRYLGLLFIFHRPPWHLGLFLLRFRLFHVIDTCLLAHWIESSEIWTVWIEYLDGEDYFNLLQKIFGWHDITYLHLMFRGNGKALILGSSWLVMLEVHLDYIMFTFHQGNNHRLRAFIPQLIFYLPAIRHSICEN